ncbi:hypothetical protein [Streptomyces boncukensis]|uniref:Uncharacterized protein n=1 Tax=Streptomyces boncukensis TaxID=2711219 RepID=A0A6G4X0W7_9ACTN|nr:hypothetical protein [Streptomyces boncukensis]NGO71135.1 hypothetical protein [Streptomyces boncukensis]
MPVRSAWLLNRSDTSTGQSRTDTRLAPLGTMVPEGPLTSRDGVIPGSSEGEFVLDGLYVFGEAEGMTAVVAPGRAVVQSTAAAGAYPVVVTEYAPLTFADGDPDNPRIDRVVLRIYDGTQDASGRTEAALEIVEGTPSGAPEEPATPSGAIALAAVTVPAGTSAGSGGIDWSSAVADRRRPTVAVGGVIPQSWGSNFPGAYPGQYRDVGDGGLERWDGAAWQPYPALPVWREWTPDWTTSTGQHTPSFGNASVDCRYVQLGTLVHASFNFYFGSTTKFSPGGVGDNWRFSLPVRAAGATHAVGFAGLQDTPGRRAMARVRFTTPGVMELEISSAVVRDTVDHTGLVDAISPWPWAAGMRIAGTVIYEAAEAAQ